MPANTDMKNINDNYDVVIIGGGPAGSAVAINLAKYNRKVLLVEKAEFPRFRIGESLTASCAEMLKEMGLGPYMETAGFPVKHGVAVHGQTENSKFWVPMMYRSSAGVINTRPTWQVSRKDFDKKLLDTATERGTDVIRASAVDVIKTDNVISGVRINDIDGNMHNISAKMVADASGQSCFLGRNNVLGAVDNAGYEKQIAIFAHVKGAVRDPGKNDGNTHIFYGKTDHWSWLIPINKDVTSLGVVIPNAVFKASGLDKKNYFLQGLETLNPYLKARAQDIEIVSPVRSHANYSFEYEKAAGPGFISIGDSFGFLDPIFSFGVTVALKEGMVAADEIENYLNQDGQYSFAGYQAYLAQGREVIRLVIDTFWQYPLAFLRLAHFSHANEIAELFSGRFYSDTTQSLEAVHMMRELLNKKVHA